MDLIQLIFAPFFATLPSITAIVGRADLTLAGLVVVMVVAAAVAWVGGKVADKLI